MLKLLLTTTKHARRHTIAVKPFFATQGKTRTILMLQ